MLASGVRRVQKTFGCTIAVRLESPDSGIFFGVLAQKFRTNPFRLSSSGRFSPSWLPGTAKMGAG